MTSLRRQQGFLAVIVAILIAVVAFASLVTSYQFSNKAAAVGNTNLSMQAYYLAASGIERAKYDITVNELGCTAINGTANYTAATFPNATGVFTVTGTRTQRQNTLSAAMTNVATTIPLTSSTGFASAGTVLIDSELMNYTAVSGNSLTGVSRGIGGTTAAAHVISSQVSQNQCVLVSTGGVPNLTSPVARRVLQVTLIASSFSPGQNSSTGAGTGTGSSGGAGSGVFQTAMAVGGSVSLASAVTVRNGSVTTSSGNFPGSTIMSGGPVVINSGGTQVSNGGGGYITSSSPGNIQADISQNNPQAISSNLWNNFFNQSKATVQAGANQTYNSSNIYGASGTTIWTNDLNFNNTTGSGTIGTTTSPVVLIVNGNVNTSGTITVTINGLLYVTGSVAFNASTTNMNGLFALEGAFNANGTTNIYYNPGILTGSGAINTNATTVYSKVPSNVQESFA